MILASEQGVLSCKVKRLPQDVFVNGNGIGNVALANDQTTSSAQSEMDFASLLRVSVANLPRLLF